jgi:hypothetical protein
MGCTYGRLCRRTSVIPDTRYLNSVDHLFPPLLHLHNEIRTIEIIRNADKATICKFKNWQLVRTQVNDGVFECEVLLVDSLAVGFPAEA